MTNGFKPRESVVPGYYHILSHDKIIVNRYGNVLKLNDEGITEKVNVTRANYDSIYVDKVVLFIHRLVCEAFRECPGNPTDYQVNHIDHNKLNNDLDNLEWVTRAENIVKAFQAGVRTDNIFVETKDIHTDEVVRYYSINECARQHKCSPENVRHHLKGLSKSPFKGRYKLRVEGTTWPRMNASTKSRNVVHKPVVIVCPDGKVVTTRYVSTAADYVGMDPRRLAEQLKGTMCGPVRRLDYELYMQDKYEGSLEGAVEYKPGDTRKLPPRNKKVAAKKGNSPWIVYPKAADLTPHIGLGRSAIQKRIKQGNSEFEYNGWSIKYL